LPPLAAPVDGYAAYRLAAFLREHDFAAALAHDERSGRINSDVTARVRLTAAKIEKAGKEWLEWRASVDESVSEAVTETGPSSDQEITPDQAAVLLKVTPSRVRQLLRDEVLNGRRVGRQWLVAREVVIFYRDHQGVV
jgi:excisionase family DNA binding protein